MENNTTPPFPHSTPPKKTPEGGLDVRWNFSPPLTDITVEETSFHMGGGDETVPAPRWLLTVDVVEDVGRCNRLHKLTSRPDAGTLAYYVLTG